MPPKHRLGRKRSKTQLNPRTQRVQSSTDNTSVVHSADPESVQINGESSLDLTSIPSLTDAFTISANDRQYIQLSKRILQYEMKRKRLNVRAMSEQAHLKDGEISLSASVTSDWRVISQDSITEKDIQLGCISLFDQVASNKSLSQSEMNHAIRFLKYAGMHIERRIYYLYKLLEAAFPDEEHRT
ncbi:hypothetical protein BLNAU_14477 [Blattamonas nauphoetae]|uniref:Uncharacterized protein n=1 Tax=Blattamonas nauphoetae TaxID=2049346 RepID=A0ABQ9XGN6_9EUKA|nr:hypothetical protein BLNAU_14477 [Blattamonas nauphoetae]